MKEAGPITLRRDVEAIEIPAGNRIQLRTGTTVYVTQSLGGTFTVMTDTGYMVRIARRDADALGMEPAAAPPPDTGLGGPASVEKAVWDELRTVYDPEIPVNVVELGLIYKCEVEPLEAGGHKVAVQMTLTAPGCGMGDVLKVDAEQKILGVPGVKEAKVEVVFDPPWDPSRMTEAARLQLGMM